MVHYNRCPVCSSDQISEYLDCKDHFLTGELFALHRCSECGFIFTQDHPDERSAGKYYDSDEYVSHDDNADGLTNRIYRFAREIMLKRKRAIVANVTGLRKGSLLDTGCGTGHFAGEMKRAGWKVTGIEPNRKAREYARARFGFETLDPGEISQLEQNSFDCITLWHVLEHFHDLENYMAVLKDLLKPGGVVVVALPNSDSFDCNYYREFWAAYDVPRHLWHFNPRSFREFSEKSGFLLTAIKSLPLDVFYISILSRRYKGAKLPFITGLLQGLWFFIKTINNSSSDSSLIYILRKVSD